MMFFKTILLTLHISWNNLSHVHLLHAKLQHQDMTRVAAQEGRLEGREGSGRVSLPRFISCKTFTCLI